ncbi:MAG: hypothetical protein H6760_02840 [Candidatus Nomurabacteria bacterium]|nr:MAG: hypothetical protein H6760_02840 [Candidatus Nomurabacteria bacterium]
MRSWIFSLVTLLALSFSNFACGGKEPTPPESSQERPTLVDATGPVFVHTDWNRDKRQALIKDMADQALYRNQPDHLIGMVSDEIQFSSLINVRVVGYLGRVDYVDQGRRCQGDEVITDGVFDVRGDVNFALLDIQDPGMQDNVYFGREPENRPTVFFINLSGPGFLGLSMDRIGEILNTRQSAEDKARAILNYLQSLPVQEDCAGTHWERQAVIMPTWLSWGEQVALASLLVERPPCG